MLNNDGKVAVSNLKLNYIILGDRIGFKIKISLTSFWPRQQNLYLHIEFEISFTVQQWIIRRWIAKKIQTQYGDEVFIAFP